LAWIAPEQISRHGVVVRPELRRARPLLFRPSMCERLRLLAGMAY
jgi:hypothetical protein